MPGAANRIGLRISNAGDEHLPWRDNDEVRIYAKR